MVKLYGVGLLSDSKIQSSFFRMTLPHMHESTTFWQRFVADRGGVLIVGHGTRNREGTLQFLQLASQFQDRLQNIPCQACFLELADPSIEEGVEQLKLLGVERLLIVPVLLFSAGHAKSDIPDAVAVACEKLGVQAVAQSVHSGLIPRFSSSPKPDSTTLDHRMFRRMKSDW